MSLVGVSERVTQDRLIVLFLDQLNYTYLGNWEYRDVKSNIEEAHRAEVGQNTETIRLINWAEAEISDFAMEEGGSHNNFNTGWQWVNRCRGLSGCY